MMLARAARVARLYGKLQVLHLRAHLEYEADFWIGLVGIALTHGSGFLVVWIVLSRVPSVQGWRLWEVAVLYALAIIPRGLGEIFYNGQWRLRQLVNEGEFDRLLVRPLSPLVQVITQVANIHGFGPVALGGVILARATTELHMVWTPARIAFLGATVVGSTILIGSIHLATNCIVFWDAAATSSFPFLVGNCAEFAKFPTTLYGRLVQFGLTWVLPFAFVSYYPGAILLHKPGASPWLGYAAPLVGPLVAVIAGYVWRRGIARYQGTGH